MLHGERILDRCSEGTRSFGLILLEIDDFAALEALFGEDITTTLTYAAECRLWTALPEGAGSWQAGRGQFAVSLPGTDLATLRRVAAALQRALSSEALTAPSGGVHVTACAGCALAPEEELTRLGPTARRALAAAHRKGRGSCEIKMADEDDTAALVAAAESCLAARRLLVAFQPVRRLDGTGPVAFQECLVRMSNDGGDPVPASRFVPGLVMGGHGAELDRLVLDRALSLLVKHPRLRLSVNLCGTTLSDPGWMAGFEARAAADMTLAERLIVELPARVVLDEPIATGTFLERLRGTGASVALDGFGTVEIGLGTLRSLQLDMAKAPVSVLDGEGVAEGLATLAERVDVSLVATGVESEETADRLSKAGFDYGQGLAFGRPDQALARSAISTVAEADDLAVTVSPARAARSWFASR